LESEENEVRKRYRQYLKIIGQGNTDDAHEKYSCLKEMVFFDDDIEMIADMCAEPNDAKDAKEIARDITLVEKRRILDFLKSPGKFIKDTREAVEEDYDDLIKVNLDDKNIRKALKIYMLSRQNMFITYDRLHLVGFHPEDTRLISIILENTCTEHDIKYILKHPPKAVIKDILLSFERFSEKKIKRKHLKKAIVKFLLERYEERGMKCMDVQIIVDSNWKKHALTDTAPREAILEILRDR